MQVSSSVSSLLKRFKNVPLLINPSKIYMITDINYLSQLEKKYDIFLETNIQLLDLYNIIDELLDIRNEITMQICRLKRKAKFNEYYKLSESEKRKESEIIQPNSLTLTQEQKEMGYSPFPTKEYKCGCKTRQYQRITQKQTKRQITVIQKQQYCFKHLHYFKTKQILETELTKINIELLSVTRKENEI